MAGIVFGGYVAQEAGVPKLTAAYILASVMIWMYPSVFKNQILTGNIVIATLSALVPMAVLIDIPPIYGFYGQSAINLNTAVFRISGFSVFIFATVLSREIIKDIEEFETDDYYDWKTLPFVMGAAFAKRAVIGVNAAIILMLCFLHVFFMRGLACLFSFFYMLPLMIVPLVFISRKVHKAIDGDDYRRAGNPVKLVILAGIVYCGILRFIADNFPY